jgi:hypothetical protein
MKLNNILFCICITFFNFSLSMVTPPVLLSANANCLSEVTVTGSQAQPNAAITVFADLINIGNSQANASGNFNFTIQANPPLSAGTHSITVTQTVSGQESNSSNALNVEINAATLNLISATLDCSGNYLLKVVGSNADVGSTINVFANSNLIGSGKADSSGKFNFTILTKLSEGTYSINVTQTNSEGCSSQLSDSKTVLVTKCSNIGLLAQIIINKYGCN